MRHSLLDHIPIYGVTKEEHDKWAEENDRAFTDAFVVVPHHKGPTSIDGGRVPPKDNSLNRADPVAQKLRGSGSAQR